MGKIVVVAEKPSVGRDIARVLGCRTGGDGCLIGEKHIVTWAVGHLVTLVEPNELDPKYQNHLPFSRNHPNPFRIHLNPNLILRIIQIHSWF